MLRLFRRIGMNKQAREWYFGHESIKDWSGLEDCEQKLRNLDCAPYWPHDPSHEELQHKLYACIWYGREMLMANESKLLDFHFTKEDGFRRYYRDNFIQNGNRIWPRDPQDDGSFTSAERNKDLYSDNDSSGSGEE